jgi:hypothetical protein
MIKQIEDRGGKGRLVSTIDIKNGQPNALPCYSIPKLNFISVGLDPFTQGKSLVIQHCILPTMLPG